MTVSNKESNHQPESTAGIHNSNNTGSPYSYLTEPKQLPQPYSQPIQSAIYKQTPADFIVHEVMDIDFTGEGEHLWVEIEKTKLNTNYIAQELAKWAKIPQRDVGYSGLKDRFAITRQWFSLRIPKGELPSEPFVIINSDDLTNKEGENKEAENKENNGEKVAVLQTDWHNKKLNRSTHKRNRFIITLKEVTADKETTDNQLQQIVKHGVPNYFGEQRFGRDGGNLAQVLALFDSGELVKIDRQPKGKRKGKSRQNRQQQDLQSILLSSARSAIFNQILAKRVTNNNWNTGLDGEAFNLAGSGSIFVNDEIVDDELKQRLSIMDIHPTGAMWGVANPKSTPINTAGELERDIIDNDTTLTQLATGLEEMGMKSARRPLRLPIHELSWQWQATDTLVLSFELPSGSYATSLLASLIAP